MATLREHSKILYSANTNTPSFEQINTGSLQRIADAVEKMASSWDGLIRDRDYYKRRFNERTDEAKRLAHSNAALRGYIKRMKARP